MTQKHKDNCKYCGAVIPKERNRQSIYCSNKCREKEYKDKWHILNPEHRLPTSTVGVLSEHRVIIDLLTKGYEVFCSINPHCSCDLAILKGRELLRVEVTTGRYALKGRIMIATHDKTKYDILAIVIHDKIQYKPELPPSY